MKKRLFPLAALVVLAGCAGCDRAPRSTFEHPWKNRSLPPDEKLAQPEGSGSMSAGWNQG